MPIRYLPDRPYGEAFALAGTAFLLKRYREQRGNREGPKSLLEGIYTQPKD
jgi:hypothetical protein